jgi:hypothetical protein
MPLPKEDPRAAEFIGVLQREKMKTHCKRDGSERVILLYEAPAHIQDGEPCLVTVYEYAGANTVPTNTLEKEAVWDSDWEENMLSVLVNGDVGYTDP